MANLDAPNTAMAIAIIHINIFIIDEFTIVFINSFLGTSPATM
ncbi:hypothetical protein [Clostridium haemolyticum]|nr:hypothetical protein [Clostridium haemolyticum]